MSIVSNPEFIALYRSQSPTAQLRTRATRVFTFYIGGNYNGDSYENATTVVKGPYISSEQIRVFANVKMKSLILKQLLDIGKPTLIVLPSIILSNWLEFPNVNPYPQNTEIDRDRFLRFKFDGDRFIPAPVAELPIRVVNRQGNVNFLKLTQFLAGKTDINTTFVGQMYGFSLVYTYAMMFLLQIGDIGLSNTLVDIPSQRIYVIDIDESTEKNDREGRYFFLRGDPAKAYNFDKMILQHINVVLEHFQELVRNVDFVSGVNYHMRQLYSDYNFAEKVHDFAFRINEAYPELQTGVQRIFPTVIISREEVPVESFDCPINIFASATEPISLFQRESLPMAQSRWIFSGHPPVSKISMNGGFRSAVAPSGNPISVISSMLQKSIRRNALSNALIAMSEMYAFSNVADGKAVVTNLINRLCVIAVEDIGVANVPLVIDVLFTLSETRNTTPFNTLAAIVSALSESQHSRFCSHIFRVYSNLQKMQEYAKILNKPELPLIVANSGQIYELNAANTFSYPFDGVLPASNTLLTQISQVLSSTTDYVSRYRIITLMSMYFIQASKPVKGDKNPMLKPDLPMQAIRDLFDSLFLSKNMKELFLSIAKSVSDKRAVYTFAAVFAIFNFQEEQSVLKDYQHLWETNEINISFLTKMRMGWYEVVVDEVVKDIHTGKKKTDASMHAFRTDGAAVANEYPTDENLKALYV